eukprot:scaffold118853_cov41-Attheya_sp.AAC.1
MPLQVPLPNVNGVESLSAGRGKIHFFMCGSMRQSQGSAGENLRESLSSVKRRDWELCRLLQTFIPVSLIRV